LKVKASTRQPKLLLLVAVMALTALLGAGCGSSNKSSSSTSSAPAASSTTAAAKPNPKVTGKTIGFVDILGVAAIEKRFFKSFKFAAEKAGWTVQFQDGEGDPGKILAATQNFVNSGVDAIVFNSVPGEIVKPATKLAKAKGITTINLITTATPGIYDGDYDEDEATLTPPLAEKIKQDFPNGAKLGLLEAQAITASRGRVTALKKALAGSNVTVVDEADLPEATPQAAGKASTDMLNAHGDINAIVGIFDQFSSPALAAIKTTHKDKVKYYSFYADSVHVPLMKRPGSRFVAVVDSNIAAVGPYAVDQLLAHFATGKPVQTQVNLPITPVVITKDNLPSGADPDEGPVPFAELTQPYLAKWATKYGLK
jgi:ABC-type sugar transport system substrate-binding protein